MSISDSYKGGSSRNLMAIPGCSDFARNPIPWKNEFWRIPLRHFAWSQPQNRKAESEQCRIITSIHHVAAAPA